MRSKAEIRSELKRMLHDMLVARATGASHPRFAHAQGCVDGYMRALLDSGQVTQGELLEMVALERSRVSGPATRDVPLERATEVVAA